MLSLESDTLSRCLRGAAIFNQGAPHPVIVPSGKIDSNDTDLHIAHVMSDFLVSTGIHKEHVLWDRRSGHTHEDVVKSAKILREQRAR